MKKLTFAVFAAVNLATARADIVSNDDFHDGKAHWKGDLRAASASDTNDSTSLEHPNTSSGVIVDLKSSWTQLSQIFNSHETSFTYKISYQLSNDYAAMSSPNSPGNSPFPNRPVMPQGQAPNPSGPPNVFLSKLLNTEVVGNVAPPSGNNMLLLVVDMTNFTFQQVHLQIDPSSKDVQTATGTLNEIGAHDDKTLFLVLPAGKGSVTLTAVSLTPASEQKGSPSDSPFH